MKRESLWLSSGTYPEYLTDSMKDAIECYLDEGGRWVYLGGNGYWWVTSFHNELPGALEVRRRIDHYGRDYWNQMKMVFEFEGVDGGVIEGMGYEVATPGEARAIMG